MINLITLKVDSIDILKQAHLIDKPCSAYAITLKNY